MNREVMFYFEDDDEVQIVPGRRPRTWFRLTGVTVHFYEGRPPQVWAGGERCKKNGTLAAGWGRSLESVDCPDPEWWIEMANSSAMAMR